MRTQKVRFSSGARAILRPVPPYLLSALSSELPLPPVYPKINLQSEAGSSEQAPALPDSPEYVEYRRKQREWQKLRADKMGDFALDYGTIKWQFPGEEEWHTSPPEGWEPDDTLARWGLNALGENLRVAFIKQELILTDADMELFDSVANAEGPLTEEEIDSALVPFVSKEKVDQSTGLQEALVE